MSLLLRSFGAGDRAWNELVGPYRKDIAMEGYSLHAVDMGQGPPVICVHGYCDSTYSWHRTAPALVKAGLRAVLVDQPGFGRSGSPEGHLFSIENQAGAVLRLADELSLDRFGLVGHSMGGGIALYLCLNHSDRMDRAVAIAPATKRPSRRLVMAYPGMGLMAELVAGRLVFSRALQQVFTDRSKVTRELVEEYAGPSARRGYWRDIARLSKEYFSDAFDRTVERFDEIRVPLLVVWGERDRWLSARRGTYLAGQVAGSRLEVIPEAGHNVHQEAPELVNRLVLDHLLADLPG